MAPARRRIAAVLGVMLAVGAAATVAITRSDGGGRETDETDETVEVTLERRALDFRSLDGRNVHPDDPERGAAGSTYARTGEARYADGIGEPVAHPAERRVSNRIFADLGENIFSARGVTHWAYAWGQFVLHDLARAQPGDETTDLAFDPDDPLEDYTNELGVIPFTRSATAEGTGTDGPRQHINELSAYLDGSVVYGTTPAQLDWLRAGPLDGVPTNNSAYLLTDNGMLPRASSRPGAPAPEMELTGRLRGDPDAAFIAGDVRANENWALASVHTLMVREHNRIVDQLPDDLPDEVRFQIARRVVIAEIQAVTFDEFLPALGVDLGADPGYDRDADPTITHEFATAAFRMHSMVHGELRIVEAYGGASPRMRAALAALGIEPREGELGAEFAVPLEAAFANPESLRAIGADAILQALSWDVGYANDETVDDQLRSILFQVPTDPTRPAACVTSQVDPTCFSGVVDLAAIDVARGYDHGLPTYNQLRVAYGLDPVDSFTALTGEASDSLPAGATIDDPGIVAITGRWDGDGRTIAGPVDPSNTSVVRVERASTRAARLASLYGTVDEVDAFTGMQTERRVAGTELGELQLAIWTRQFTAIRAADPWWSTRDPVLDELAQEYGLVVERSLDQIVRANARTLPEVPEHLFGV